jgi:hypothetical protein
MAVSIYNVPLIAAGDDEFTIYPNMIMVDKGAGAGREFPDNVRIRNGGYFSNCSYVSTNVIHIDNPAGATQTFEFEIEYYFTGWTYTASWYMSGTAYHSLGHYNISTTLIGDTIGSALHTVSGLELAGLINPYSKNKPDGATPSAMGEWRLYTHYMPGGCGLNKAVYVEDSPGSGNYVLTTSDIPYLCDYKILGYLATRWVALPSKPYDYMKIQAGEASDLSGYENQLAGCRGMLYYSAVKTNDDTGGASVTYYVKSFHCATSGGSYVEGDSLTVSITHSSAPWSYSITATYPKKTAVDTAELRLSFTWGLAGSTTIRFSIMPHASWEYCDMTVNEGSNTGLILDIVHADAIGATRPYKFEVNYPAGSGDWVSLQSGNLPT